MTTTATETVPPGMKKLMLRGYEGITHRLVSTAPPRDCTSAEIPIIDLAGMYGDLESRKNVATELLRAAETMGFFYIKNHGISEEATARAYQKTKDFFNLPLEQKQKVASTTSHYGYHGFRERQINPSESKDRKEFFTYHYEPEFDPTHANRLDEVPEIVRAAIPKDSHIWAPVGVEDFQPTMLGHWRECLGVARRMIRLVALSLGLAEDYFDSVTTYPGGDATILFYPGHGENAIEDPEEVGIGAHTDLQILTLLWQDDKRGLQVLNHQNEWVFAPPIPGTFVVNIGDFLMRLTNDRLKSTVHRVIQHGKEDRYSMPFFFGFDFDKKLGVLPVCVDEEHPAKYEAATCGELIRERLALGVPHNEP